MASKYFSSISRKLPNWTDYDINDYDGEDPANLKLLYEYDYGVQILGIFCMCLEVCDYTADEQEQGKEISLRSIITHLKRIWVQEDHNSLEDHFETWPKHIQDFDPVSFGLERKFEQSKPLIERCCQILVRSSSMQMIYKSSTNLKIPRGFVDRVYFISWSHFYGAAETVPFKNQIDILKDKLEFMYNSFSRVDRCTDSNELVEYKNLVHAFYYNAACLLCMYWAKEENEEEIATEMNILLFDMLHNIKPCAAHVTTSYFAYFLKSNNLLQSYDDSLYVSPIPASFVDFFFEHTILKDDYFLILRERLIVLFTFLADATQKNAEGEDVIRSQIYVLLHEDAYLLLPITQMKEDLSNNKMLLSDCINKIDILTANIIQFYCRPSDSPNRLEAEKMNNIFFASLQRELSASFENYIFSDSMVRDTVHLYTMEIRFVRLFFQCFETWDDSDEETRVQLCSVVTSLQRIWRPEFNMGFISFGLNCIRKNGFGAVLKHLQDLKLKEKFQMSKHEINAWLVRLSHCSFHCRPSKNNKIVKFLDSILHNMRELKDAAFEKQIEILEEKLLLLKNFSELATNCMASMNLDEFNVLAQVFANNAACLIYLCWAKEADDDIPAKTNLLLSNMLQKIKPATPDVARTYIGTLKTICLQPYDFILLEQTATSFVDYFFEDVVTPWKNGFQILRDEVIFLLTFVHHHHTGKAEKIICSQLDVLFNDGVYELLPFDDMKGDFSKKNVGLTDFMSNIETENAKIRQLYCQFPDSFLSNFPRMIGQGFLDSLIQKLRKLMERLNNDQKHVPCAKDKIKTIEEELLSLTPSFYQILELKDLNNAWLEVINVVYLTDHVISLCLIFYHSICHYILYLFHVVDRIKAIRAGLEKIEECNMYNSRCLPHSTGLKSTPLFQQDQTSEIHGVLVGFKDDKKIIINNIVRGTKSLDIVSIVGMGGLGKTTLAKQVYGSSSIKSHFNVFAFTNVSQYHDKKRLLLDILKKIVGVDAETSCMTEDDLAHKLKKCLSHQKYFIVLDDIWDINVWYEVRSSFPDHQNGSRIMFTTRSFEVAKRGQIKCPPYRLGFLSKDESWKLLQMKVFPNDMPPPNLSSVAKLIAKQCGGLPLAIVVIAGVLARTETSLWIDISKRVSSCLSDEGCVNVLELSYKSLPEYLKPCLIYLGAFPEDSTFKVIQVTLLWIAEGFIKESKTESLNDVAKKYLQELVDRSLIIVDKMIIGEIRTFRVHDLIHDLCQKKCRDANFFRVGHDGTATSSFSAPSIYKHYRVSVQKLSDADVDPSLAITRSLLCIPSYFVATQGIFHLKKFRLAQVLHLGTYQEGIELQKSDFAHVTSLIDLRHIQARMSRDCSIPSSICNLWNMQSLILDGYNDIYLPKTLWRMSSLRYVKVRDCMFEVSDDYELNAYPQLDKVVSFSRPHLSFGKDVEWLLQRLPAVRKLGCILDHKHVNSIEERVETLDFHKKLESLKLRYDGKNCPYSINFPSTLIKLSLTGFRLPWTAISAIAELQCLRILKLRQITFPGPTWEMEDVTFPDLKYFELLYSNLVLWNANIESFPCLEELLFHRTVLKKLPPCFGEIPSLKKITIRFCPTLESSARQVQEEQLDWGNKVDLVIRVLNSSRNLQVIREKAGDVFGCLNAENGFDVNVLGGDLMCLRLILDSNKAKTGPSSSSPT